MKKVLKIAVCLLMIAAAGIAVYRFAFRKSIPDAPVSEQVRAILEQNDDPEALLRTVMSDFDLKILETCPVSYKCYCSRQRVERALISLGKPELEQMLAEQGGCQLTCQFCDAVYDFSADDLRALIAGL